MFLIFQHCIKVLGNNVSINIKEPTYANGKDETDLSHVPVHLAGTSRSDVGINTMVDTVTTPIAAIAIDIVQMKGKISHF